MTQYTLNSTAYVLPLLHAAAHPSSTVLGVFLGTVSGDIVEITDALPLVHRYASLSLTTELGLQLAQAQATKSGTKIVGIYQAREGSDTGLSREGRKVLEAIGHGVPQAFGLVLDNTKLSTTEPIYTATAAVAYPPESVRAGALRLVRADGVHASLRDLDDHLDDARVDWIANETVRTAIARLG